MGNFVYLKYTKSWKNVYLKYTKLHRWSLQADKHCSYGAVFTGRSPFWAALVPVPDFALMPASMTVLRGGGAPSVPA